MPCDVAEDLDLDVASALDVALEEHGAVAERRRGLATGAGDRVGERAGLVHDRACPGRRRRPTP